MPTIFQIPTFIQILEFIGTFAFAISGIRLASAKQFDWFGAYVAGVAVAIGGGTIRDVLLDVTPFWMTNPIYLICSALALLCVVYSSWYQQDDRFGVCLLGSHYYGNHDRCGRWSYP